MIGRFSDLPERLRATTLRMASRATVDFGLWNEHSNVTLDAALKIEALERDLARAAPSPETLAMVKEAMEELIHAARILSIAAQTTGGVAGPDAGLMNAIELIGAPIADARAALAALEPGQ